MLFKNFQMHADVMPAGSLDTQANPDQGDDTYGAGARTGKPATAARHVALVGHGFAQADLLTQLLAAQGYQACVMDTWPERVDGTPAMERVDLVVLDVSRTRGDAGVALISRIRAHVTTIPPILVLADELAEGELASLYDAGADDVMFKPLRVAVFSARLQALARRVYSDAEPFSGMLEVGTYVIDLAARQLRLDGQLIKLSSREYELALYLFNNVGRLVSRATLEKAIWGRELGIDSKTLDTHVYRLRVKLRLQPENGLQLASVYAQGFRLIQVLSQA